MKLVDTAMLASHYGVSREAVSKWRQLGLKCTKLSPHTILYDMDEVNQFFKNIGSKRYKEEV